MKSIITVFFILLATSPCFGLADFAWQEKTPHDFLLMLKNRSPKSPYVVMGKHENWITITDIPLLIDLLDSSESCAPVNAVASSYLEVNGSTIGEEAAFLILGFIKGEYPPDLNSTRPRLTEQDKDELRKWWRKFNH